MPGAENISCKKPDPELRVTSAKNPGMSTFPPPVLSLTERSADDMKKALVLAGGIPQIELIRNLQRRGYFVLLADYFPDPPARKFADEFHQVSTLDEPAILALAKEAAVDFVITCCTDQALLTVADVSGELGLPCYIDAKTARNVTNKRYMKQVFREAGIPTAKFLITTDTDPEQFRDFRYPLVVKPVDCNSSKGVIKVYDRGQLAAAMENAAALSRTHDVIVEEYMTGVELSCDFAVRDGVVTTLSLSESQKVKSDKKFVICRSVCPPRIKDGVAEKIRNVAQQIADAFGLYNSPLLIQFIYDGDEDVSVIEFSARTGGAIKYRLVWNMSHVDVVDEVVELTLNGRFDAKPEYQDVHLRNEFLYCENGELDHVEGLEELLRDGTVNETYLFKTKGDRFTGVNSSGDRVAALVFLGESDEEVRRRCHEAVRRIRVIDRDGKDILKREINLAD